MAQSEVKGWSDILITGILMSVLGLLMMIFQAGSLDIILIVFGVLLLLGGAINVFIGIRSGMTAEITSGVVKIVLGIVLIMLTALVRDVLMAILAVGLIIVGAVNIFGSVRSGLEIKSRLIPLIVGIAFLVVGIYALLNLNSTADFVMIVIGIITLAGGLLDIYDAYMLKTM